LNAAVWFGAAIFLTFGAAPVAVSPAMEGLLGPKNFPYFSDAISQLLWGRYLVFQIVCACVALLHVLCERLYLGKPLEKLWLGLLIGLFVITLSETALVEKKLTKLNTRRYATNLRVEDRQAAAEDFQTWRGVLRVVNIFAIGGLGIYLWHMANPADPTRFVSANKFRS
jgi:hypothetical protein